MYKHTNVNAKQNIKYKHKNIKKTTRKPKTLRIENTDITNIKYINTNIQI